MTTFLQSNLISIETLITAVITILGWLIISRLTYHRDEKNRQKNIQIEYLVNAYRDIGIFITRHSNQCLTTDIYLKFEIAVRNIQIYGQPEEIELLHDYINNLQTNNYSVDPLLNKLRDNLRESLDLDEVDSNTYWIIMQDFAK
jgi:hypothetical protein